MWFKKNLLVLIVGAVIGAFATSIIGYPIHLNSKRSQKKAFEKQLAEKNVVIQHCITKGFEKDTYTNNNEFNPNIGKNKKGVIEIKTFPDIDQKIELPIRPEEIIKENIQVRPLFKPPIEREHSESKATKNRRRGKGNWQVPSF